jgi:ATP-dependent protease ClpP protease subunit
MTASIFINGVIGGDFWSESPDDSGTTLADVRRQIQSYESFDQLTVFINSPGGNVEEGFAIHDLIRSYGKPVTTVAEGQVFSIATVIFLAGDKGRRLIAENSSFGIHNPTPAMGVIGEAKDFEDMAARLRAAEDRIINFYHQKTNIAPIQLRKWMDETTQFLSNQAIENGFADGVYQTLAAVAYFKTPINMNEDKQAKTLITQIRTLLGLQNETPAPAPETETTETAEVAVLAAELEAARARVAELEAAEAQRLAEQTTVQQQLATAQAELSNQAAKMALIDAKMRELENLPLGVVSGKPPVVPPQNQPTQPGAERFEKFVNQLKQRYGK